MTAGDLGLLSLVEARKLEEGGGGDSPFSAGGEEADGSAISEKRAIAIDGRGLMDRREERR